MCLYPYLLSRTCSLLPAITAKAAFGNCLIFSPHHTSGCPSYVPLLRRTQNCLLKVCSTRRRKACTSHTLHTLLDSESHPCSVVLRPGNCHLHFHHATAYSKSRSSGRARDVCWGSEIQGAKTAAAAAASGVQRVIRKLSTNLGFDERLERVWASMRIFRNCPWEMQTW